MAYPNNYRIVFTSLSSEDVSFAATLDAAKREANDLIKRDDVEYAIVYDHRDSQVYQAFS